MGIYGNLCPLTEASNDFSGPASLEQKLRIMQKQLLEMTDVPLQIQSKIAMVTKALEQFMTMDPEAFERASIERVESKESSSEKQFSSIPEENEEDDDEIESNDERNNVDDGESFDHFELEHSTRETSFSLEELEQQYKKLQDEEEATDVEKSNEDDDDDGEKSACESVKSEEMLKLEEEKRRKNEKILKLEESWQKLCSNTKTIHKWVRSRELLQFCFTREWTLLNFS